MPYRQAGLLVSESFGGIAIDVWTHLAYVRDGGSAVFYVNVALTGSPLTIPLETPTGLPFYMGVKMAPYRPSFSKAASTM